MRIVLSWLRELAPTDLPADDLAELLVPRGVHVEAVLHPWSGLEGVVVARVVSVEDHPNSEKLCVAVVDDGTGEHQVVVGVRNMAPGDLVPWARPGSRVPGLAEPLGARELRGVVSNGMLCSPRELAIADVHTGILLLNDEGLAPGADVRGELGLDDAVLDIEVEPNRPDFLSVLGVAREVAAATGGPLVVLDTSVDEDGDAAADIAGIRIDALDGCPWYLGRVVRGIAPGSSPIVVQARLTASGMRPVSNVVDATNYVMLETGQPLHAFDLSLLHGPQIVVRRAQPGERIVTLDDIERELTAEDLLIADPDRAVAIAGIMGADVAEVSDATTDVLIESAYFTRTGVLRTARRLDLHTEASARFERGTDPEGVPGAAARAAALIVRWGGGRAARGVTDTGAPPPRRSVRMRATRASTLLGYEVTPADAAAVFDQLALPHEVDGDEIDVDVPGYRVDIEAEVDLIEEVARVNGYDRLSSELPVVRQAGGAPDAYVFAHRTRDALVRAGLREACLLSFASQADLDLTGDTDAIRVTNPLVADERFMRTRLTPGLLHAVARNQARGVRSVALFEVGSVFRAGDPVDERPKVAFVLNGAADRSWYGQDRPFDVLDAKGALEALLADLRVDGWALGDALDAPLFHPGRACSVTIGGERAGVLGEIHPRVAERLEITGRVAIVELEGRALQAASGGPTVVRDVPRFPPLRRDLAFIVPEDAPAGAVRDAIIGVGGDLMDSCELFDVFRGGSVPEGAKSLAFSLGFRAPDRTLTDEEADERIAIVVEAVARGFGGELRAGR